MKKTLLTCGALLLMGWGANAQLSPVDFNAAGLPAGWSTINVDGQTISPNLNASIVSGLASAGWMKWPVSATDSCMLTTSYFNPAGKADRWLVSSQFMVTSPNTVLKWDDYCPDATYTDSVEVWVSPTGGNTVADFTTKLYAAKAGTEGFTTRGLNLGAYNGQNIRIAFRDNSTDEYVLMVDNVSTTIPANATDGKNNSVSVKTIQLTTGSTNVVFNVTNTGAQNITSLKAQYVVDAAAPVSYTFPSLNITPFGSQTLQFPTPITGLSAGSHTVTVTLLQENGNNDPTAADNVKSRNFAVVDPATSVNRNGLIEEFSSSTCSPCAAFNGTFDPISENGTNLPNNGTSRYNLVRYQMNWPSPGTDYSYNNEGLARRTYYDCNSIPEHWVNGAVSGTAAASMQSDIDGSKTDPAFMTISGTFQLQGGQLKCTATCTPKFTITGADMSVHMAVCERHYVNNGPSSTVGQTQYYHVMRTMNNSGNGAAVTSWTANTPQNFSFNQAYTNGSPAQGNHNFWTDAHNSDLVVFVQDNTDQSILQSISIPVQWATGVKELNGVSDMAIFPNPATSQATLGFNTTEAANISISMVDAIGRTVYTYSQRFEAGSQRIVIPTGNLAAGIYNVRVQTENGVATTRLTVAK
ncbi:MAG: T9SS type A sorting domain-containing protein [Bacteroidetes bacterium]|nr:T9SS type A sorting domain-containing protein [Bacteroidota bacterium]